jgi:integrase
MCPDNCGPIALAVTADAPLTRLLTDLPTAWRQETIGPDVPGWRGITVKERPTPIRVGGLPLRIRVELAWMAHWQFVDGTKVTASQFNQAAEVLRSQLQTKSWTIASLEDADEAAFLRAYQASFESRHGRLPPRKYVGELQRVLFGYPRLALAARLNHRPWWTLDDWIPRCDPRIPLRDREPQRAVGCRFGHAQLWWVREAIKWHLGHALESGSISWSTIASGRLSALLALDRWLLTLDDPAKPFTDLTRTAALATSFRTWVSDPANRIRSPRDPGLTAPAVNKHMRAVIDLMAFIADNRDECRRHLGPSPWDGLTDTHAVIWRHQILRERKQRHLNDEHYIDDTALAQITSSLPMIGAGPNETVTVTVNGESRSVNGYGAPQLMRMLLLQMLTGRRASEICLCDFDCLSPATDRAVEAADGEQVASFRYAQSKIDQAPDTILVDAEVVAVIEEQQQFVRARYSHAQPRYLFPQHRLNAAGNKPMTRSTYGHALRKLSELLPIKDGRGRTVWLSRTHRFRHTRITKLAELGLPVHVLQRYAGHTTATMSMHYVAQREEHAEQAFLATRKFRADGSAVTFSREDHDSMHLFDRADRFLPHGYCLLPPLQSCDKGNACLTCSVFVTDTSHLDTLQRQLAETEALIERTATQFQQRHHMPMPADNIWLAQRTAEKEALTRVLESMRDKPGRACQGAGSPTSGAVPIAIDTTSYRRRPS